MPSIAQESSAPIFYDLLRDADLQVFIPEFSQTGPVVWSTPPLEV